MLETARAVTRPARRMLRGGAFKPRTSPYSFQGLGAEALELLAEAREETGLPVVTEVMTRARSSWSRRHADMLQIGARNMQNFHLLAAVGETDKPVLLKRGLSATIEELLIAAEYILSEGNRTVILCERGIRTFETATRNTLDLGAVPVLKGETHLPSSSTRRTPSASRLRAALARAAKAVGADGVVDRSAPGARTALCERAASCCGPRSWHGFRPGRVHRLCVADGKGRRLSHEQSRSSSDRVTTGRARASRVHRRRADLGRRRAADRRRGRSHQAGIVDSLGVARLMKTSASPLRDLDHGQGSGPSELPETVRRASGLRFSASASGSPSRGRADRSRRC